MEKHNDLDIGTGQISFEIGTGKIQAIGVGLAKGADLTAESKAYWESLGLTEIGLGKFLRIVPEDDPNSQSPSPPTDQSPDSDR